MPNPLYAVIKLPPKQQDFNQYLKGSRVKTLPHFNSSIFALGEQI
jgi:hypothetical protein